MTIWFKLILVVLILAVFCLVYYLWRLSKKSYSKKLGRLLDERTRHLKIENEQLIQHAKTLTKSNKVLKLQADELKVLTEAIKKENKELKEINSTKDKFFSIIAHDLKNPFTTIFGFVELLKLKRDFISNEKRDVYIDSIYSSSEKIYNLLENLLQWSRSQTDRLVIQLQKFNINETILKEISLLKENAETKNILLKFDVGVSIDIFADKDMVATVLRNLVSNAIKYTSAEGEVRIELLSSGKNAVISVIDTGVGLTKDEQHKLFRIEDKISKTGTMGEEGTGLGLLLCKEFVEKSGGTIWVDSKLNKGTKFTFTLPLYAE